MSAKYVCCCLLRYGNTFYDGMDMYIRWKKQEIYDFVGTASCKALKLMGLYFVLVVYFTILLQFWTV